MREWCSAHPWMTFFIVMSLLQTPLVVIRTTIRKER